MTLSSVLDKSVQRMAHPLMIKWIVMLFSAWLVSAQQCDQPMETARFDCHPEPFASAENCLARYCCWEPTLRPRNQSTVSFQVNVPACYYSRDFPAYKIIANESTAFGQRFTIMKQQSSYLPNEILNLTVDLLYESAQRFRLRIYDPTNKRFEVPLQVPVVPTKANVTDYEVSLTQAPFAILVKRRSTGMTL